MGWYLGAFKKYAQFEGRARRREFWMFQLFNLLATVLVIAVGLVLSVAGGRIASLMVLLVIYILAAFLPGLSVSVRRLHDIGKPGWWLLLSFIPLVGWIFSIVLLVFHCLDSQPGPNQYGPNPKYPQFTPDGYGFAGQPQPGYPPYPPAGFPQGPVEGYGPDAVRDFNS